MRECHDPDERREAEVLAVCECGHEWERWATLESEWHEAFGESPRGYYWVAPYEGEWICPVCGVMGRIAEWEEL
jgi:hypothetical protein